MTMPTHSKWLWTLVYKVAGWVFKHPKRQVTGLGSFQVVHCHSPQTVPILDFWGPTQNCVAGGWGWGGGGWGMDETHLSVFHSVSNRARRRRSRNSISSRYALNSFFFFFFFLKQETVQDFYIKSVTAHVIKRNDHSCFHNSWTNSKIKIKLKHLWEQGGPLVFRGPYAACVFCV